ncbi:ABC transporter substrate-binding protein [Herbiconiux sp. CPCC 203407]|uniref:ABC transporter substrate-binding protein n=1 Tax=Herbiconiux oxytropis TaxID=2970915 RepID=A0AA41XF54_9MICO|nr:ABC transporter substrate-binding protein [Herbiconiux oxytropis]MCS5720619.1 ABC transporter substrate-binding protein [Herbiconiux oxytropis]MCS5725054.1 ABC transporter substrate-binding protein [Herbiconiux oxytropis]
MHSTLPRSGRRVRSALAIGASVALLAGLSACVETPEQAAENAAAENVDQAASGDLTFYLVPGLTTHPAYLTMYCGAQKQAEELGVGIEYQGATTWDPSQQIPVVQALLAKDPSALILTPTDGTALAPVVKQYVNAGIPVIATDTTLADPSELTAEITSSNEQGGAAAADALGESIGGTGSVAIISGAPGATTDEARVKGFTDRMAAEFPDVKLLEIQYSKSNISTAASQVQALILANPDLAGVFGVNGNSATGAANAIAQAGKKADIHVAGYDAEPATVKLLEDGSIEILVVQDFQTEGRLAVQYAYDAATGNDSDIVRNTELENVIATTENASDPEISKYFYKETCE